MAKTIEPNKKSIKPADDLNTQNRAIKKVIKALEKEKHALKGKKKKQTN